MIGAHGDGAGRQRGVVSLRSWRGTFGHREEDSMAAANGIEDSQSLTITSNSPGRGALLVVSPLHATRGCRPLVCDGKRLLRWQNAILRRCRPLLRGIVGVLVPREALRVWDGSDAVSFGNGLFDQHFEVGGG